MYLLNYSRSTAAEEIGFILYFPLRLVSEVEIHISVDSAVIV